MRAVRRALPILAGLLVDAAIVGWAATHVARASMELVGSPTFVVRVPPGEAFGRHSWEVHNAGAATLRLRTRFTSGRCGFSLWQGREHAIGPGERLTVHLAWPIPSLASRPFASYATIATSDPARPEFRLKVVGISGPAASPP